MSTSPSRADGIAEVANACLFTSLTDWNPWFSKCLPKFSDVFASVERASLSEREVFQLPRATPPRFVAGRRFNHQDPGRLLSQETVSLAVGPVLRFVSAIVMRFVDGKCDGLVNATAF